MAAFATVPNANNAVMHQLIIRRSGASSCRSSIQLSRDLFRRAQRQRDKCQRAIRATGVGQRGRADHASSRLKAELRVAWRERRLD